MSASVKPLNADDLSGPGCETLAVGCHGDYVILTFPTPVAWVAIDPKTAYQVAEVMCRNAFAIEIKDKVEGEWSSMVQKKRQMLLAKIEHALISAMTNGKLSDAKDLNYLAAQIRDHADDEYLGPRFSPT